MSKLIIYVLTFIFSIISVQAIDVKKIMCIEKDKSIIVQMFLLGLSISLSYLMTSFIYDILELF